MKKNSKAPSMTQLRKLCRDLPFNPNKEPMLKIVAEQGYSAYYESSAIVAISLAQQTPDKYDDFIVEAMRMLLLARAHRA